MAGVNKVILVGNLGADPEVRETTSGVKVASFSIATSESWVDRTTNEKKEVTDWHNIVLWRGLAGIAEQYLKKGGQVYIEGKLKTRSWDDDNGKRNYRTEVVADNMVLLGSRSGSGGQQAPPPTEEEHQRAPISGNAAMSNEGEKQPETPKPETSKPESEPAVGEQKKEEEDDLPF